VQFVRFACSGVEIAAFRTPKRQMILGLSRENCGRTGCRAGSGPYRVGRRFRLKNVLDKKVPEKSADFSGTCIAL
jgi:hypothetical protein